MDNTYFSVLPIDVKNMLNEERIKAEPNNKMVPLLWKQICGDGVTDIKLKDSLLEWGKKYNIVISCNFIKLPEESYEVIGIIHLIIK